MAAPGLRERQKLSTRRALEDAALRLFARDGYDATTVEAIAAEVEVSPRTFFRYFRSKDEVVDMGWSERESTLTRLVTEAPADLPDLAAAAWALAAIAGEFESERDRVRLRARAVATSPALRGRVLDSTSAWQRSVADALAHRREVETPDLALRAVAAAAVSVWVTALAEWLRASDVALAETVGLAFAPLLAASAVAVM